MSTERVVGGAGDAVQRYLMCTASSGYFTSLNNEWERLLGWTQEELMSRPVADFVHPADRERSLEEAAKVTRPGYQVTNFENRFQSRFRARGGGWRWLRWSARTDGATWIAVAVDVTEEKEADAARHKWLEDEASEAPSASERSRPRSAIGFVAARVAFGLILLVVLLANVGVIHLSGAGSTGLFGAGSTIGESTPAVVTPRVPPGIVGAVNGAGPLRAPGLGSDAPPAILGPRR